MEYEVYLSEFAKAWLATIKDTTTRARISRRIDQLERGLFGDRKSLGDGVYELRLDFGPGYRVYYAFDGLKKIILLGGSDKSSQSKSIEQAKRLWEEYHRAKP